LPFVGVRRETPMAMEAAQATAEWLVWPIPMFTAGKTFTVANKNALFEGCG
jgi:hypothetical protein